MKKGRLGIDFRWSPGVDLLIDLDNLGPPGPPEPESEEGQRVLRQTYSLYDAEAKRRATEMDLPEGMVIPFGYLPFPNDSIKSIISHHVLEHIGEGFMALMDEVHRVLEPGGLFRIIVPAFPSEAAVGEPTHVRYFTQGSWQTFISTPDGGCYTDSFAEPYGTARFISESIDVSPYPMIPGTPFVDVIKLWEGAREFRVALRKHR